MNELHERQHQIRMIRLYKNRKRRRRRRELSSQIF